MGQRLPSEKVRPVWSLRSSPPPEPVSSSESGIIKEAGGRKAQRGKAWRIWHFAALATHAIDICRGIGHLSSMVERHVKLFKNGRNQAVRIPREFELPGEDAIIRKDGQRLIIEPAPPQSLLAVLAALPTLDEEFPPI